MDTTPNAERIHIGIFGRCNSGKSSLVNALTGQQAAIVSHLAGTTTDPVRKGMEFPGLGAVVLTDTAGYDDTGGLGADRLAQTRRAAERCDIALMVVDGRLSDTDREWIGMFRRRGVPVVAALNKCDLPENPVGLADLFEQQTGIRPIPVSALTGQGVPALIKALALAGGDTGPTMLPGTTKADGDAGRAPLPGTATAHDCGAGATITGELTGRGEVVLLVMPQDTQAPKGRLILPQVQTLRELLDKGCIAVSCTPGEMETALAAFAAPPALVITDSQVFAQVERFIPSDVPLTSFSVLFAHYKGDAAAFAEGAAAIDRLTATSRVLIAEACTHAPADEDIGRVKIPRLLRARAGEGLAVDVVGGEDFPDDLTLYDLVIHCGACMFNRRLVLARIARARKQGVPLTNYGIALAHLAGILHRVVWPGHKGAL